jgi:hypothetical protein
MPHHIRKDRAPFEKCGLGVGLVNALVLAKVMLVADDLRLGEWRGRQQRQQPLIYPVVLRSILFAVVFIVFDIIEKMLIGVFQGKAVTQTIETPGAEESSARFSSGSSSLFPSSHSSPSSN